MKKFLLFLLLCPLFVNAQQFSTETVAAQTAVNNLASAAETRVASLSSSNVNLTQQVADLTQQVTTLQGRYTSTTIIPDIQKLNWGGGVVGTGIGGSTPKSYGWTRNADGAMVLAVSGNLGEYDDWLTGVHFYGQPSPSVSRMFLDLTMSTNADALLYAQAFELDTLVIADGLRYEMSSQLNYNKGGMLQVSTGNHDGWHDTGWVVGKLTPDVKHRITWEYNINRAAHTVTFVAFTLDGVRMTIPPVFSNLPAYPSAWRSQVILQLQQDTNTKGGSFTSTYDNMTLVAQ